MCRGIEPTSPWHCVGVMETQVALIAASRLSALLGMVSLVCLLQQPIDFLWGSGQGSLLANHAHCGFSKQLLLYLAVWTGAEVLLENKNEHPGLAGLLAKGSMECSRISDQMWWTSENTADQHQQITRQPGYCAPPDSGAAISLKSFCWSSLML